MNTSAANPLRRNRRPLAGAAGTFLFPRLAAATGDFVTRLGLMGTETAFAIWR